MQMINKKAGYDISISEFLPVYQEIVYSSLTIYSMLLQLRYNYNGITLELIITEMLNMN